MISSIDPEQKKRKIIKKILKSIGIILASLLIAYQCLVSFFVFIADAKPQLPSPIFENYKSYSIDYTTIIDEIESGNTDVFFTGSEYDKEWLYLEELNWTLDDYLLIAITLHEQIWDEPVERWRINGIYIQLPCDNSLERTEFIITLARRGDKIFTNTTYGSTIKINPYYRSITGIQEEYLAWTFFRPEGISYKTLEFPISEVFQLAEETGGLSVREKLDNQCQISLTHKTKWTTTYRAEESYTPIWFIRIDRTTGEILEEGWDDEELQEYLSTHDLTPYPRILNEEIIDTIKFPIAFVNHFAWQDYQLNLTSLDGERVITLLEHNNAIGKPTWSASGKQLAFTLNIFAQGKQQTDIYIYDFDLNELIQITNDLKTEKGVSFSPTDSNLAFQTKSDIPEIYFVNTSDGMRSQLISAKGQPSYHPVWSPDGNKVGFIAKDNDSFGICVYEIGTAKRQCKFGFEFIYQHIHWAKDSSTLFFNPTGSIYSYDYFENTTTKMFDLPKQGDVLVFSTNLDKIAILDRQNKTEKLWVFDPKINDINEIAKYTDGYGLTYGYSFSYNFWSESVIVWLQNDFELLIAPYGSEEIWLINSDTGEKGILISDAGFLYLGEIIELAVFQP